MNQEEMLARIQELELKLASAMKVIDALPLCSVSGCSNHAMIEADSANGMGDFRCDNHVPEGYEHSEHWLEMHYADELREFLKNF